MVSLTVWPRLASLGDTVTAKSIRSSVGFLRAGEPGALATGGLALDFGGCANGSSWAVAACGAITPQITARAKVNNARNLCNPNLLARIRRSLFRIGKHGFLGRLDALQSQGGDRLRLQVYDLDAMVVGISHVELAVGLAQSSRLVQKPFPQPAGRLAEKSRARALLRVNYLDLAVVSVGDIKLALVKEDAESMLQANLIADPILVAEVEKPPADNGFDFAALEGDGPNGADFAIGDVERVAVGGQTARLGEGSLVENAVSDPLEAVAGIWIESILIQFERPNLMEAGLRD